MTPIFQKKFLIPVTSSVTLLIALTLFWGQQSLDPKIQKIQSTHKALSQRLEVLQNIPRPDSFLPLLQNSQPPDINAILKSLAQKHHLTITSLETTDVLALKLTGTLDTDIYDFLHTLEHDHAATLVLHELGLFRQQDKVIVQVMFKVYQP